jgi:predicted DNA binding CopG/RHH family protein
MKKLKNIPSFKNEKKERDFWQKHDSARYFDYDKAELSFFPSLKHSVKTISIRLPEPLINSLKILGNRLDIPYQSLMKKFLSEKVRDEFKRVKAR